MGNTTSTHRGTYSSKDQVTIAERRRVLTAKIHPKIAARKPMQRRQLKMNIPQNTSLEYYDVVLSRCADVWHRLSTVTQPPRCAGQEEKSKLPRMKPSFIFHRGDFGNPSHNSLISVVSVTKATVAAGSAKPFQDRKVFVHLFELRDLAQDFASYLQGLVHDGMLHRVGVHFDEAIDSLKASASFWPRTRHLGIEPIGGEEVKNRLEETEYPKFTIEWCGKYGEALVILLAWPRLSYYFKYLLDLA
jgi:hypothetical protein